MGSIAPRPVQHVSVPQERATGYVKADLLAERKQGLGSRKPKTGATPPGKKGRPKMGSTEHTFSLCGTKKAATRRPLFWAGFSKVAGFSPHSEEVAVVLHWRHMLHVRVLGGKRVLHMTMDGISVKLWQDAGQGMLEANARRQRRTPTSLVRTVTRGKLRAAVTHAAFLCEDSSVQSRLPHVLIAGALGMSAVQAVERPNALQANLVL